MTSHLEEGQLQELLDGEIPSSELSPIQTHLASCAECRARLDEARAFGAESDRLIETIDLAAAPARLAPRIPPARPKPWIRSVAWAATVVIAAGTGYLVRGTDSARVEDTVAPAVRETKATPIPAAPAPPGPLADASPQGGNQPAPGRGKGAADGRMSADAVPERRTAVSRLNRELAASPDSDSALGKTRRLGDTRLSLSENVVTAAAEPAALRPPAPLAARAADAPKALGQRADPASPESVSRRDEMTVAGVAGKRAPEPVEITLPEALKRLDGSLRLIEGLVPLRLEVLGPDVRVVYPLASGELLLAQRLENGKLVYRLLAPAGFPADSLERLRARVRD